MKQEIKKLWLCKICKFHDWTSLALEGKLPKLKENPTEKETLKWFLDTSRMYCKRCDTESEVSKQFANELKLRYETI